MKYLFALTSGFSVMVALSYDPHFFGAAVIAGFAALDEIINGIEK